MFQDMIFSKYLSYIRVIRKVH